LGGLRTLIAVGALMALTLAAAPGCTKRPVSGKSAELALQANVPRLFSLPDRVTPGVTIQVQPPDRAALVALVRWGSTTLAWLDLATQQLHPFVNRPSGEMDVAMAGADLGWLMREGANPARNYIEVLDLQSGATRLIEPANGFAMIGFALNPAAPEVAYSEMNLRASRSRHAYWRTESADLAASRARQRLSGEKEKRITGEAIPVPFGWTRDGGKIFLRGLLPFRAMTHDAVWAMGAGAEQLTPVIGETAYTGVPQLSPDGRLLAYLSTDMAALPERYIAPPGAPPGNRLVVLDLATGKKTVRTAKPGRAFGQLRWAADASALLMTGRVWARDHFDDDAILVAAAENSFKPASTGLAPEAGAEVSGLARCAGGPMLWVENKNHSASLRAQDQSRGTNTIVTLADGTIRLVGCLSSQALHPAAAHRREAPRARRARPATERIGSAPADRGGEAR
jgi:hypothetical protein